MPTDPRVVLVDGLADTRDVLSAIFEPQNVVVDRLSPATCSPSAGPDVLVLQNEKVPNGWECVPRVVIGRIPAPARFPTDESTSSTSEATLPSPFDYADLVEAVESMLETSGRPA